MSGLWVWCEHRNGKLSPITLELLGAARNLADELGESLTALVLGEGVSEVAEATFDYGADNVIGCDDPALANFRVEISGRVISQWIQEQEPAIFMAGASTQGRDLTAWVAAELDAGAVADGIELRVEDDRVVVTRPVYAGKLLADVYVNDGLQIISLRGRAFPQAEATGNSGEAEWRDLSVDGDIPTQIVGFESSEGQVSLTDARIIVSGGRGVGSPAGFGPVRELAGVLGAAVGASRATVDAGWIPYEHQVGQTGKTVSPDLYIACGISGAIQHQAGMRTSKVIVAINKDGDAPIFSLARYGVVGDLFEFVPALTAEFKKRLG